MNSSNAQDRWHQSRMRAEKRFKCYGQCALGLAVAILVMLIGSIVVRGYDGFSQTQVKLPVHFDRAALGMAEGADMASVAPFGFQRLANAALLSYFPEVTDSIQQRELRELLSGNAGNGLKTMAAAHPDWLGQTVEVWLPAASKADLYVKHAKDGNAAGTYSLSSSQELWVAGLKGRGVLRTHFNSGFFTQGNSRMPEQAGFVGAMAGSALTLIVCLLVAFPVGVMTAIYLEEFARQGKWVDLVEVNINNLAAVPSIVFGLLGLAVYINALGLPRSAPLVGGLTLALMILPVIIIATRASLKSIPGSIRDAARGLGATPVQVVLHHVLPLSMPGIMTGTILGLSRAIGETAPLLMIGMVAFVADVPSGFTSASTVMPVQIYLWASSPEAGFVEKTAAGILVLLMLLLAMNALAVYLRKRFEVRW